MIKLRKLQSLPKDIRNNLPSEYYYIGRPSKFGNPYSSKKDTIAKYSVSTKEEAIEYYEKYLHESGLINDIGELQGKILVCWCINSNKYIKDQEIVCHGQILQKYLQKLEADQQRETIFNW